MTDMTLWNEWCERRDGAAFERLVAAYATFAYDFARRVTGQPADAEDLMQDAFLELAKAPPDRPRAIGLRAYLGRSIVLGAKTLNRLTSARRRRDRRAARPEATMQSPDVRADAEAALAMLDETQRAAATLRFLHGCSYAEIAATLGLSEAAARMRVHRALAELRKRLGPRTEARLAALAPFVPGRGVEASIAKAALLVGGVIGMKKLVVALVILLCLAGTTLIVQSDGDRAPQRAETRAGADPYGAAVVESSHAEAGEVVAGNPDGPGLDRAPGAEGGEKTEVESDPAIVEGRILGPDGTPVPDMELHLREIGFMRMALLGGTPAKPPIIRTDAKGRFRFVHAPLRDLQKRPLGIGNKRTWISLHTLAPRDKEKTDVDLVLVAGLPLEGIVHAGGRPIADQQVQLQRRGVYERGPVQGREGWTFTDVDGRFRFEHLPPGQYALTVRAKGLEVWAGTVEVAKDAAPTEIVLKEARELVVRFENLPDEWKNASVYLHLHDADYSFVQTHQPNLVDGVARVPAPPSGKYSIRNLTTPGHPLPAMETKFEVTDARVDPIVFKLDRGAGISGAVSKSDGSPFVGTVQLEKGETSVRTDARGRYRFASAQPGPNRLRISLGSTILVVGEIDVPASGEARLDIRLAGGARIRGKASSDVKQDFYRVELLRDGVVLGKGLCYDGTFRFDHLAAGAYTIRVRANEAASGSVEVTLAQDETRTLEEIRLQGYPRVPVKVTVPDGVKMPPYFYISTVLKGKAKPLLVVISGTGDGHFSGLPPGSYTIHVSQKGYQARTIPVTVKSGKNETVPIALER